MMKGYEFAKDQYVTFSPEELKELEEKGTGTVEMMQNRSKAHARRQARAMPARRTGREPYVGMSPNAWPAYFRFVPNGLTKPFPAALNRPARTLP
ncbi:MAG: hypothetical protein LC775_02385 [Acidobacteria bacterium]|nr:hypothetical protein [Acidobacteriota bacterium]